VAGRDPRGGRTATPWRGRVTAPRRCLGPLHTQAGPRQDRTSVAPDARIATAPAPPRFGKGPTPATARGAPFGNGLAERSAPRHPGPLLLSPWGGSGPRPSRRPQPPAATAPRSVERDMARLSWRHLSATARFTPSGGVGCEREPRRALSTPASCEATLARIREMGAGVSPRAP
jgi:hypothetical protein